MARDRVAQTFADESAFLDRFGSVDNHGKSVDNFAVDEDVEFDEIALFIADHFIIERRIAAGLAL